MGILTGKTAVITGSTRGLGLAIARAYTREGAAVVISSRSAETVDRAVARLRAETRRVTGLPCDVGDMEQVQALAAHAEETFGGFDIWVNNAGVAAPYGPTAHIPPEGFLRVYRTNILGVYHGSVVAMRRFLAQGHGKLINVLGRGARRPVPMQNAYAASKAWVRSFTLALAREYRESGVGIYAFSPGLMDTDLLRRVEAIAGYEGGLRPLKTVMRLWANPPEVPARKAVWLASDATDGRTGLEVRILGPAGMARGVVRDLLRRLLRRPAPSFDLEITTIPPAIPEIGRPG